MENYWEDYEMRGLSSIHLGDLRCWYEIFRIIEKQELKELESSSHYVKYGVNVSQRFC